MLWVRGLRTFDLWQTCKADSWFQLSQSELCLWSRPPACLHTRFCLMPYVAFLTKILPEGLSRIIQKSPLRDSNPTSGFLLWLLIPLCNQQLLSRWYMQNCPAPSYLCNKMLNTPKPLIKFVAEIIVFYQIAKVKFYFDLLNIHIPQTIQYMQYGITQYIYFL